MCPSGDLENVFLKIDPTTSLGTSPGAFVFLIHSPLGLETLQTSKVSRLIPISLITNEGYLSNIKYILIVLDNTKDN